MEMHHHFVVLALLLVVLGSFIKDRIFEPVADSTHVGSQNVCLYQNQQYTSGSIIKYDEKALLCSVENGEAKWVRLFDPVVPSAESVKGK